MVQFNNFQFCSIDKINVHCPLDNRYSFTFSKGAETTIVSRSILKKSQDDGLNKVRVKNKRITWSKQLQARIIKIKIRRKIFIYEKKIDSLVEEGSEKTFFKDNGAKNFSRPSTIKKLSLGKISLKKIKEIQIADQKGLGVLDDEVLSLYCLRLVKKQKNIYQIKRSNKFQKGVSHYIELYLNEIKRRSLLSSHL